jgi:hypothetical protein
MAQATPLPNTLGETVARCQALLGDPTGQWVKRYYIVPFIQQAYSAMAKAIKNASGKNFEAVVEVLKVPTGTSDLSIYQKPGDPTTNPVVPRGALYGLFDPLRMWVKTADQLPQYYTQAWGPRDTLPHVNPPGITPGTYAVQVTFAWIGNRLSITPVAGPIDVQVYGRFNPPRLQADEDQLLLADDMTDTLAFLSCAIAGVERANPAVLQGYAVAGDAGIDNIVADIIRQCQKNPRRLAKMGGQGGSAWGWGSGIS